MALEDTTALGSGTVQTEQTNPGGQSAPDARQGQGGDQGGSPPPAGGEGGGEGRSLAQGGGEERPDPTPTAKWPDDWRQQLAGGDEALLKQLNRYASPANYAKAGFEAQQRLRAGQAKEPLPENPTPEQVTAWRKDNGIPEAPDGYKIEPGDGLVFGEADKPMLDAFRAFAHERNWTPAQVNQGAAFVAQHAEQQRAAMDEADKSFRGEAQETLREEWGREFQANIAGLQNVVNRYSEPGTLDLLMGGRTADGRLIGDNPAVLRLLSTMAREINPLGTVVPAGTQDGGKAIETELAELKQMMRNDPDAYYKADDGKNEKRYRQLLEVQAKVRQRG
ncbi:hypothetical protein [Methylobacterium sp.]|uniref:hypothetical protein n=1 Tax=Methylobacterium sp. TaxID=409 RepID=UPI000C5E78A3|nr:hypothetical protein [Methylobacterium sp.]MBP27852.1 hypothetical protein [Methylobacterium sp.]